MDVAKGIQPLLKIWTGLVQQMLALYSRFTNSDDQWQKYYNEILLWKNKNVESEDGLIKHSGKLLGIKNDGSIQISSKDGMLSFNSGSLARAAKITCIILDFIIFKIFPNDEFHFLCYLLNNKYCTSYNSIFSFWGTD